MRHVLICLVVLAATYFHTAEAREETNEGRVNTLQRTLLSPTLYPYARCLDGSPSGYYINRGDPTRWVVFLQGGGLCFTKKSCEGRTKNDLGTSHHWSLTKEGSNLFSSSAKANPDFASWTHVFVPYCGGDLHSGRRTEKHPTFDVYFSGHLTLEAIADELWGEASVRSQLREVLLTGDSAGGIGAFEHTNWLHNLFNNNTAAPPVAVASTPQGGMFIPDVTPYPAWVLGKHIELANLTVLNRLYDSFIDPVCEQHHPTDRSYCGPAKVNWLLPYIQARTFPAQNRFDTSQLSFMLWKAGEPRAQEYLEYFGNGLRASAQQLVTLPTHSQNGIIFFSCEMHTGNLGSGVYPQVQNASYFDALGSWYFNRTTVPQKFLFDDCGSLPCNPHCKSSGGALDEALLFPEGDFDQWGS